MTSETRESLRYWERHAILGAAAVIIGLLAWGGTQISETAITTGRIDERSLHMIQQISKIEQRLESVEREVNVRATLISRVTRIEKELDALRIPH